jgi:hypothetical protein
MAKLRRIQIVIDIAPNEYQAYYTGTAKNVVTTSIDGRTIRFPASILRPFVTYDGVQGHFVIEFDEDNKLVAINRIDS